MFFGERNGDSWDERIHRKDAKFRFIMKKGYRNLMLHNMTLETLTR